MVSETRDAKRLLRVPEVAARYGYGKSKLYEWIASGELPSVAIGRTRRVAVDDIEAFIAQHRVTA